MLNNMNDKPSLFNNNNSIRHCYISGRIYCTQSGATKRTQLNVKTIIIY